MEIQNKINEKIKEIKDYLDEVGMNVEEFEYSIKYQSNQWEVFVEGTSIDGEEQTYEIWDKNIDTLFNKVKREL